MRRICWDIDRLTGAYHPLHATKSKLEFSVKEDESLFEVVTVRRWSTTRGNMDVDQAKAACRVFACQTTFPL